MIRLSCFTLRMISNETYQVQFLIFQIVSPQRALRSPVIAYLERVFTLGFDGLEVVFKPEFHGSDFDG